MILFYWHYKQYAVTKQAYSILIQDERIILPVIIILIIPANICHTSVKLGYLAIRQLLDARKYSLVYRIVSYR